MSVDYLPQPNDTYAEDISTLAAGTVLVGRPCQVWQITIIGDTAQTGIVNFSDTSAAYSVTYRKIKAYVSSGQYQETISFSHGLNCTRGLCCTANVAGIDIFVSYD